MSELGARARSPSAHPPSITLHLDVLTSLVESLVAFYRRRASRGARSNDVYAVPADVSGAWDDPGDASLDGDVVPWLRWRPRTNNILGAVLLGDRGSTEWLARRCLIRRASRLPPLDPDRRVRTHQFVTNERWPSGVVYVDTDAQEIEAGYLTAEQREIDELMRFIPGGPYYGRRRGIDRILPLNEDDIVKADFLEVAENNGGWSIEWRQPTGFPAGRPSLPTIDAENVRERVRTRLAGGALDDGFTLDELIAAADGRRRPDPQARAVLTQTIARMMDDSQIPATWLADFFGISRRSIHTLAVEGRRLLSQKPSKQGEEILDDDHHAVFPR